MKQRVALRPTKILLRYVRWKCPELKLEGKDTIHHLEKGRTNVSCMGQRRGKASMCFMRARKKQALRDVGGRMVGLNLFHVEGEGRMPSIYKT